MASKYPVDVHFQFLVLLIVYFLHSVSSAHQAKMVIRDTSEDVNYNSPEISINTLAGNQEADVSENLPVSSFVAHVSVFDIDSGTHGEVTCTLDHPAFDMLSIHRGEYKIVTSELLDRERFNRYTLEVECQDQGNPGLSASEALTVNVLDENDHSPEFQQSEYSAVLTENNAISAHIITVIASDRDIGPNADLRYYIVEPTADEYIHIHVLSGEIMARRVFDYEHIDQLEFTVIAIDQGEPPRSATTSVQITITDTNDEAPQFTQTQYSFGVFENNPINVIVGGVRAIDQDSYGNNAFVYSMTKPQQEGHKAFRIDERSGEITTLTNLDREETVVYHMTVYATDVANPSLVGSASVTIYVADVNDNSPIITSPDIYTNTFSVSVHAPVGHIITTVSAIDHDIGANARLTFSVSGDDRGLFAINARTGVLRVAEDLGDLNDEVNRILIHVRDSGYTPNSAMIPVTIVVD